MLIIARLLQDVEVQLQLEAQLPSVYQLQLLALRKVHGPVLARGFVLRQVPQLFVGRGHELGAEEGLVVAFLFFLVRRVREQLARSQAVLLAEVGLGDGSLR